MVDVRFINDTTPITVTAEQQETTIGVTSQEDVAIVNVMPTGRHDTLSHRNLPNQHPISAITGLQEALDTIPDDYVSDAELEVALNAKQDVISDLSEIRSGAEKGETALQPNDNVSELVNDAGYITDSSLPTVNNATLTIQKNNVSVGTFTANSSTDTTINITVPTTASDVSALPSSTKYSASLSLSINSSTYVITAQLKDQDGNNLGSAQTIDLPLESVVVSGSYDDQTKKIILTLQNGSTVEFSVADLVSGLQTEITSQNMLDADLVDDSTSTNKFVTASEKSAISTAVQPADLSTVATTGSYDDLLNKPTIPAAQVNSDWNAVSGVAEILNKPSLATVATSGAYSDLTGTPTIPTVNNATLTIQKNGVNVQTFTANQATNATANITVPTDTADLTNGAGFITSSDLPTNYVTTNTAQDISAKKTFLGEKAILFKQTATTDKLGFTLYNTSNTELGAFEWRPNTIGSGALLNLNMSYSSSNYLGFRYWGTAVNIIAPKVATAGDYYIPVNVTNGNTTVTATSVGTVNISSLLPTVNNPTITITQGGVTKGSFSLNQASGDTIALDAGGGGGGSYTAGTGIDITNDVISVAAPTLTNTATGSNALTILGTAATASGTVNIGASSQGVSQSVSIGNNAQVTGAYGIAIGRSTSANSYSVAIGYFAGATANYAIQLGYGTNSEANSFYVSTSSSNNWKMLGSDGLIPAARIAIDGTSITINGSGQLQASGGGGGGGSYTAGDGIIIQNDEISVDAEATAEVDVQSIVEVDTESLQETTAEDLLKLITGYDANATQTLKNINGSIQWVTD